MSTQQRPCLSCHCKAMLDWVFEQSHGHGLDIQVLDEPNTELLLWALWTSERIVDFGSSATHHVSSARCLSFPGSVLSSVGYKWKCSLLFTEDHKVGWWLGGPQFKEFFFSISILNKKYYTSKILPCGFFVSFNWYSLHANYISV